MKNNKFLSNFKISFGIFFVSLILFGWYHIIILYQPFVSIESLEMEDSIPFSSESEKLKENTKSLSEMNRTSSDWREWVVQFLLGILQKSGISECGQGTMWCYRIQEYTAWAEKHKNIIVEKSEENDEPIFIVWAHYDSFHDLPGADDNASGVAWLLEIIRIVSEHPDTFLSKNFQFVFYSSEEPPYYATDTMWSYVHAESVSKKDIWWVLILEMIGYFREEDNSQGYPISLLKYLYPQKGNFVALISNNDWNNISLTRNIKKEMYSYLAQSKSIEVYSMNAPRFIEGVDFSDHRNYWTFDIPAIMITDTSFNRNRAYHTSSDTYDRLDYDKMKEVVNAVLYFLSKN